MNHNDQHKQTTAEAREAGYNDAYFDGLYMPGQLNCKCPKCRAAYEEGQRQAMADLMVSK